NKRKIIISTNIAETSLTIPDIVHIVDCGRAKVKNYTSGGFESLKVQRISKASTKQRAGRAGRVSHGYCYQLFGEKQYEKFEDFTVPEILRIPLENAFLQIAACGIDKVQDFEFLESPTNERIYEALRRLKQNNLLIFADGSQKLSEIGHFCSLFPLPIEMSLTIYHAFSNGSLQQVIQIIAMLSCDSMPFQNEQNEGTDSARNSFYLLVSKYGDHLTYLNCYKFYKKCLKSNKNNKKLAEFGLNESHLQHAHKVLLQIREIISKNFQDVKFNQEVNELHILRSFLFGFKANLMKLSESKTFYNKINDTHEIFIHPQSTMFKSKSKYVIFGQVVETKKCYARIVSYIDEDWLDD
ncbi:MAG: putative ATP-dependent RNA helicase dhx33, partial [Marteilia pararefringens]